jgi:hypothetical protein
MRECSISVELGIPCCHKIYSKIGSSTPLMKWDVHPRWHLRESSAQDPYRRILDPKIATALRGKPKNTTQVVPARLGVAVSSHCGTANRPSGQPTRRTRRRQSRSQDRQTRSRLAATEKADSQAGRQANLSSQRQTRSQTSVLGTGRTTGVRASGRRTQSSIRRRKSQWELLDSDSDGTVVLPSIMVRP